MAWGTIILILLNTVYLATPMTLRLQPTKCPKVVDIVMVLDESGSIGLANFNKIKSFTSDIVSRFSVSPYGAHFGLVKYSGYAQYVFRLNEYQNTKWIQEKIRNTPYKGGATYTGKALKFVRENMLNQQNDRKNVPNVVILMSDGRSHDQNVAVREANAMKQKGTVILGIAVGATKKGTDKFKGQLQQLASKKEYVFTCTFNALRTIEDLVVKDTCESVDPCKSKPCQNGGRCTQVKPNSYKCTCTVDYEGKNCEIRKKPCKSNPCKNGGKCTRLSPNSYKCTCPQDYEGTNCEIYKDPCKSNPCKNGGKCTRLSPSSYKCTCPKDYEGTNCEIYKDPCKNKPCKNGGKCTRLSPTSYKCTCPKDYEGTNCEIYKDPCKSNPCKNGGKCTRVSFDSYTCSCTVDYEGKNCETLKDPCAKKPCLNGGTCKQLTSKTYKCLCTGDYNGKNCEQPTRCDKIEFTKLGCYNTAKANNVRQMLFNSRHLIDWTEGWDNYLDEVVCNCTEAAAKKHYKYFWIEYYGECWGLSDINIKLFTYNARGCWGKRPNYDACDHNSSKPICVGTGHHGYIYKMKGPNTTAK